MKVKVLKQNRVILYVRVSTQEQAKEGYSIGEQIDRLTKYCEAMGWTIVKVYTDPGYSGATMDRPGLKKLIKDVENGLADKIVVYKLDRLSRSQLDTLFLIEKVLLANDTDFVSMNENFDTSTPFGRAMIGILAVFAQLEREQIRERMMMGKEARAKEGKFHGSNHIPIGYDYLDGLLTPNQFEKLQVVEAFNLAIAGNSPYQIAKLLTDSGYSHKYGTWNDRSVRRVLKNKTYIGYIKHNKEWFKGVHEAFITEELFNDVQKVMEIRSEQHLQYNRRAGKATTYLGGFLYCKQCGAKYAKHTTSYTGKTGKRQRYNRFICNSRDGRKKYLVKDPNCKNKIWKEEELTELVFDEIRKLGSDPEYIAKIQAERVDDERPAIIKAEKEKLETQIAKLMDLYTVGNMPLEMIEKKIHEIDDQKAKLEEELEKIAQENEAKLSEAEVRELVRTFSDILDRDNFEEVRTTIATLIEKIEIDEEIVSIHWTFV